MANMSGGVKLSFLEDEEVGDGGGGWEALRNGASLGKDNSNVPQFGTKLGFEGSAIDEDDNSFGIGAISTHWVTRR